MLQLSLRTLGPNYLAPVRRILNSLATDANIRLHELPEGEGATLSLAVGRTRVIVQIAARICRTAARRGHARRRDHARSPSIARAQQVVVFVNGAADHGARRRASRQVHSAEQRKSRTRKEVLDSLIDEILELTEAKRFSIEVPESEVDKCFCQCREPHGRRHAEADANYSQRRRKRGHPQAAAAGADCLDHSGARALQGEP